MELLQLWKTNGAQKGFKATRAKWTPEQFFEILEIDPQGYAIGLLETGKKGVADLTFDDWSAWQEPVIIEKPIPRFLWALFDGKFWITDLRAMTEEEAASQLGKEAKKVLEVLNA